MKAIIEYVSDMGINFRVEALLDGVKVCFYSSTLEINELEQHLKAQWKMIQRNREIRLQPQVITKREFEI